MKIKTYQPIFPKSLLQCQPLSVWLTSAVIPRHFHLKVKTILIMAQQIQFKKKQLSMIFCEYSFNAYALLLHEHVKLQFEPNRTDAGLVR